MKIHKLIVTGPVGSGKSAAVNAISDEKSFSTDVSVSDKTSLRKNTTTVAMDYDVVRINESEVVHLYGTPGQERFDFMWDILSKGADGLILLLDNSRNNPFLDLKYYVSAFQHLIETKPLIIGVTRQDLDSKYTELHYRHWLNKLDVKADIAFIDARIRSDVMGLIERLISPEVSFQSASFSEMEEAIDTSEEDDFSMQYSDLFLMDEDFLDQVSEIAGVQGGVILNPSNEVACSKNMMPGTITFLQSLQQQCSGIEDELSMGKVERISFAGTGIDNLVLFAENEQMMGLLVDNKTSTNALNQQINDLLQWM